METTNVALRCSTCRAQKSYALGGLQIEALTRGQKLTFYCSFCLCQKFWELLAPLENIGAPSQPEKSAKKILVVGDDDPTLQLVKRVLESSKTRVALAGDAKEALSQLTSTTYDVIVLDLHASETAGQQLFRRVTENALAPAQRILFLTADHSLPVKAFLEGTGCKYIYKPIDFRELSQVVEEMLYAGSTSANASGDDS